MSHSEPKKEKNPAMWFFDETDPKNVKVVRPKPYDDGKYRDLFTKMLHCDTLEFRSFGTTKGNFCLVMNDTGLFDDKVPNKTATQVLRKIHLNWGDRPFLCGNYIVFAFTEDAEGDDIKVDMPNLGFQEFIDLVNETIAASIKRRNNSASFKDFMKGAKVFNLGSK